MNSKNKKILEDIFKDPIQSNIKWTDIESLMINLGAEIDKKGGSMVSFRLKGERILFHRPHPRRESDRNAIKKIRKFFEYIGIKK